MYINAAWEFDSLRRMQTRFAQRVYITTKVGFIMNET